MNANQSSSPTAPSSTCETNTSTCAEEAAAKLSMHCCVSAVCLPESNTGRMVYIRVDLYTVEENEFSGKPFIDINGVMIPEQHISSQGPSRYEGKWLRQFFAACPACADRQFEITSRFNLDCELAASTTINCCGNDRPPE